MASSQLVLMVARLRAPAHGDQAAFLAEVGEAVAALSGRPGHLATRLGRSLDEPGLWVLISEWDNVGSYRRALSSYDVRMATGRLMLSVIDEPTAYDDVRIPDQA